MTTNLVDAPNLEHIKKQAKDLLRSFRAQSPVAVQRFRDSHPEFKATAPERLIRLPLQLADSQLVIAREYGFPSWPKLKTEVDRQAAAAGKDIGLNNPKVRRENGRVWIDGVGSLSWAQDRQTTFCGALAKALGVTSHPYSYVDLMGFSGLAFRTRWFQGQDGPDCCPSSPVGEFPEEIAAIARATGWPMWSGNRLGEDDLSMAPYRSEVVANIDEGRPLLAFTLRNDVGIIHGYKDDGQSVIGWDYHHEGSDPLEMPIEKIGGWIAFIDEYEGAQNTADAFIDSLKIAVSNFRRDSFDSSKPRGDYRHGYRALRGWGADIAASNDGQGEYYGRVQFVSWWNFNALHDARIAAVEYLSEHSDALSEAANGFVKSAAAKYEEERALLDHASAQCNLFAAPWSGRSLSAWTPSIKNEERDALLRCAEIEADAIACLEEALAVH
jgi:hypothetical protein